MERTNANHDMTIKQRMAALQASSSPEGAKPPSGGGAPGPSGGATAAPAKVDLIPPRAQSSMPRATNDKTDQFSSLSLSAAGSVAALRNDIGSKIPMGIPGKAPPKPPAAGAAPKPPAAGAAPKPPAAGAAPKPPAGAGAPKVGDGAGAASKGADEGVTGAPPPIHKGLLAKEKEMKLAGQSTGFNQRFFVVKPGMLLYFDTPAQWESRQPAKGSMVLDKGTVLSNLKNARAGRPHTFRLDRQTSGAKEKYVLSATNQRDAEVWLKALRQAGVVDELVGRSRTMEPPRTPQGLSPSGTPGLARASSTGPPDPPGPLRPPAVRPPWAKHKTQQQPPAESSPNRAPPSSHAAEAEVATAKTKATAGMEAQAATRVQAIQRGKVTRQASARTLEERKAAAAAATAEEIARVESDKAVLAKRRAQMEARSAADKQDGVARPATAPPKTQPVEPPKMTAEQAKAAHAPLPTLRQTTSALEAERSALDAELQKRKGSKEGDAVASQPTSSTTAAARPTPARGSEELKELRASIQAAVQQLDRPNAEKLDGRFTGTLKPIVLGSASAATGGLDNHLKLSEDYQPSSLKDAIERIKEEFAKSGTDVDKECLAYVLEQRCGDSQKKFPNSPWPMDCDEKGRREDRTSLFVGMDLDDFTSHPKSRKAKLHKAHVLGLRLYTTAAFRSLIDPLRDTQRKDQHPFPTTIKMIAEGLKLLREVDRALDLAQNRAPERDLWRGLKDMERELPPDIVSQGGTELAPMSTTTELQVAVQYSASHDPMLMRVRTESFIERGADVSYLSAFPDEAEYLFPPLTYLRVTDYHSVDITVRLPGGQATRRYVIVDVKPHITA